MGAGLSASGLPVAGAVARHAAAPTGLAVVFQIIGGALDYFLAKGIELLTAFQATDNPEFFTLLTALIEDLLGVPVGEDTIQSAWERGGDLSGFNAAGAALMSQLGREMGAALPSPAGPGQQAAQTLLGYIMGFSVREANVSALTQLLPEEFRFLEGLREYGVSFAENLGLGRMTRLLYQPWLKVTVQDPLTHELNAAYTPTLLGASLAIKAFNRGQIDQSTLDAELAAAGYNLERIQALVTDSLTQLQPAELWELYKWGAITQEVGLQGLTTYGVDPKVAPEVWAALGYKERDTYVPQFLSVIHTQYLNGFLSLEDYKTLVSSLKITPDSQQDLIAVLEQLTSLPRKRPTLAQETKWLADGIIDLAEYQAFLTAEGYSPVDVVNLTFEYLVTAQTAEEKAAAAYQTYKKNVLVAIKQGYPLPDPPPGQPPWTPPGYTP